MSDQYIVPAQRSLEQTIGRIKASFERKAQDTLGLASVSPTPTAQPRVPEGGWLHDVLVRASVDDTKPPPRALKEALGKPERLARPSNIDIFRAATAKERQGAHAASQSRVSTPSTPVKSFMTQERKAPPLPPLVPEPAPANKDRSPIGKPAVTPFRLRSLKENKTVSRVEGLNRVLRKLQSDSAGIEASALISEDGRMIANAVASSMEELRVAGMAATLLNLGMRAAAELKRGGMREVIVGGELGYVVLMSAGCGALLVAMTSEIDKLGLIYFDMQEAIRGVQKIL